jgi:hypothetical protein
MIEYFITLLFCLLYFYPLPRTFLVKAVELAVLIFVSYKNPLLGIICATIFIKEFPVEKMTVHKSKESRMSLDEQMRPKESNALPVQKPNALPIQESLVGHIKKPYVSHPGKYSPF